jgi:hypothetical protein
LLPPKTGATSLTHHEQPISDNFFATLNSAVFSDGSFVYVPEGVRCPMELSTYFRINEKNTGQFERTLIIVDKRTCSHFQGPINDNTQRRKAEADTPLPAPQIRVQDRASCQDQRQERREGQAPVTRRPCPRRPMRVTTVNIGVGAVAFVATFCKKILFERIDLTIDVQYPTGRAATRQASISFSVVCVADGTGPAGSD